MAEARTETDPLKKEQEDLEEAIIGTAKLKVRVERSVLGASDAREKVLGPSIDEGPCHVLP